MTIAPITLALTWGPSDWSWITWAVVVGTGVACVGLAAVSRTEWGRKRPSRRYAAVSVAAHLLLLGFASTVRYGGGSPGAEEAPPVTVRLVMRAPQAKTEPKETPVTPRPEPAAPLPIAPRPESQDADPSTAIESDPAPTPPLPQESPDPEPTPAPKPSTSPEPTPPDSPRAESPTDEAWSGPSEAVDAPPAEPTPPPTPVERAPAPPRPPSTPIPATPAWDSPYATRGELARRRLAEEQGGSRDTEDAVARGLDWLARAQRRDGAWDSVRWSGGKERRVLGHDRGGAGAQAETGLTGLALLALMGSGHSHLDGGYRQTVEAGLAFLIDQQTPDGNLAGDASLFARTYCHSMATFALAEALANTDDDRLRPAVRRAIGYLVHSQNPTTGGWRYRPGDRGDMSQMGWALMAIRSAEIAGVEIRPSVWGGVDRFIRSVARGGRGGLAAYQPEGPATPTMTAEALYCRQILGVSRGQRAANAEAVAAMATNLPSANGGSSRPVNLYYWYYATLALHHQRVADEGAKAAWADWNAALQSALLPRQVRRGQNAGSWTPNTLWGGYGGRVYTTALATMCLEVYYRYDAEAIGRDPWIAARDGALRR